MPAESQPLSNNALRQRQLRVHATAEMREKWVLEGRMRKAKERASMSAEKRAEVRLRHALSQRKRRAAMSAAALERVRLQNALYKKKRKLVLGAEAVTPTPLDALAKRRRNATAAQRPQVDVGNEGVGKNIEALPHLHESDVEAFGYKIPLPSFLVTEQLLAELRKRKVFTEHVQESSEGTERGNFRIRHCPLCTARFNSHPTRQSHLIAAHGVRPKPFERISCAHCDEKASSRSEFVRHSKSHGAESVTSRDTTFFYVCDFDACHLQFSDRDQFESHVALHGEWFRCDDCDRCFAREQNFDLHVERIHAGAKIDARPFVDCPFCVGVYVFKEFWPHLHNHALTLSTWEESNEGNLCDECGKVWSSEELLLKHVQVAHSTMKRGDKVRRTGGAGRQACNICSKKHASKKYLHMHILRVHTYEHGTVCYVCQRNFKTLHMLLVHLRRHTGQLAVTNRHNCAYCTKVFGGVYIRNKHHFLAHGEQYLAHRPHHCVVCFVTFDTEEDRDLHYEGHAKFRCALCSLHNLSQQAFDEHMKNHARPGNKIGDKRWLNLHNTRRKIFETRLRAVGDPLIGEKADPKEETLRRLRENPENYFSMRRKAKVENLESSLQQMEQAMSGTEEEESDGEEAQDSAGSTSEQVSTNQNQVEQLGANQSEAEEVAANQKEAEGVGANQKEAEGVGANQNGARVPKSERRVKTAKNPFAKRRRRKPEAPKPAKERNTLNGIAVCLEAQLPYYCTECSMQFSNESATWDHHTTEHFESCSNKNFENFEKKKFENLEKSSILKKYANPAFGAGNLGAFVCTFCGQKFGAAEEALKHRKAAHGIDASEEAYKFTCNICGQKFLEVQHLARHKKIACDKPQPLKVPVFSSKPNKPVIEESRYLTCSICPPPNQFQNQFYLNLHHRLIHGSHAADENTDTEISDPIAIDGPQENESKSHVEVLKSCQPPKQLETRVHQPGSNQGRAPLNQFACSTCHLNLASTFDLKIHVENVHGATHKVPPPTCNICRTTFTNRRELTRHMRSLHPQVVDVSKSEVQIICAKPASDKTKQPIGLVQHTRRMPPQLHMDRGHKEQSSLLLHAIFCSICQVTFLHEASLQLHLKTEHSFQEVERSASRRDLYLISTTDLEDAYSCSHCNKNFPTQEELDLHTEFLHAEEHKPAIEIEASEAEQKRNLWSNPYKTYAVGKELGEIKVKEEDFGDFSATAFCDESQENDADDVADDPLRVVASDVAPPPLNSSTIALCPVDLNSILEKGVDDPEVQGQIKIDLDIGSIGENAHLEEFWSIAEESVSSEDETTVPTGLRSTFGGQRSMAWDQGSPFGCPSTLCKGQSSLLVSTTFESPSSPSERHDSTNEESTNFKGQSSTSELPGSMSEGQSSASQSATLESPSSTTNMSSKSKGQSSTSTGRVSVSKIDMSSEVDGIKMTNSRGQRSSAQYETTTKGQRSTELHPFSAYNVKYTTNERSMKNRLLKHLYEGLNDNSKRKAKDMPFAFLKLRKIENFSKFEKCLENSKIEIDIEQVPQSETGPAKEAKKVKRSIAPSRGHSPQTQSKRRRLTRSTRKKGKKPKKLAQSESESETNDSDWMPSEEEEELKGQRKTGQRSRSKSSRTDLQGVKKEIEESESEDSDWSTEDGGGGASKIRWSLEVNGTESWECLECALTFCTGNLLSDHRFQVHPTVSQRTCGICLAVFESSGAMLEHRATAHAQDACELCAKKFDCVEFLLGHIERVHRGNARPYKCEECGYCFRAPSYRRAHQESVHRIFAVHTTRRKQLRCDSAVLRQKQYESDADESSKEKKEKCQPNFT